MISLEMFQWQEMESHFPVYWEVSFFFQSHELTKDFISYGQHFRNNEIRSDDVLKETI